MGDLIRRYEGRITSNGHKIEVEEQSGITTIGFKHLGEYQDEYDPYIRVARIERVGDQFDVGWFFDDAEEPTASDEYTDEEELFQAIDQAIERRSTEAGHNSS
jgi:hypothetical protein